MILFFWWRIWSHIFSCHPSGGYKRKQTTPTVHAIQPQYPNTILPNPKTP